MQVDFLGTINFDILNKICIIFKCKLMKNGRKMLNIIICMHIVNIFDGV